MPLSRADKFRRTISAVQLSAADSRAVSVTGDLDIAVLCHMDGGNALSWLILHYPRCCQPVEGVHEFLQWCGAFGRAKLWGMVTSSAELG